MAICRNVIKWGPIVPVLTKTTNRAVPPAGREPTNYKRSSPVLSVGNAPVSSRLFNAS
jgi:hypothetical protein